MTNHFIHLVDEQKLPVKNEGNNDNQSDEDRQRKRVRAMTLFIISCLTLQFLLLCAGNANRSLQVNLGESLETSWRATKKSQLKIHDALLYTPEQLHLSLGKDHTELYVTWSTMQPVNVSKVIFCEQSSKTNGCKNGYEMVVYSKMYQQEIHESDSQWIKITKRSSRIIYSHRAKLGKLKPNAYYIYKAVSGHTSGGNLISYYSKTYQFRTKDLSNPKLPLTMALYGDLGLINGQSIPRLIKNIDDSEIDMIVHNGDFAYDLNTHLGKYGDEFMRLIEPIAARVPYQTSVGNHEIAENFTHYDHRFTMINSGGLTPGQQNNFYYSFNVGPVHFVAFSTEFYYFLDSVGLSALHNQYQWLERDLKFASSPEQRAKRPWIIVFGHRPMYCSSRDNDDCTKENNILRKGLPFLGTYALEKLFYDYGVDVELYSHEHQYERFLPIYDGKIMNGTDDPKRPYLNPNGPVHIISGSAGCQERLDPFTDKPATGSIVQIPDYGYTRLKISNCELTFEQVSDDKEGDIVDSFTITKTRQTFPARSDGLNQCCGDNKSKCNILSDFV